VLESEAAVTCVGPMPTKKGVDVPTDPEPTDQEDSHKSPTTPPVVKLYTLPEAKFAVEAIGAVQL